MQVTLNRFKDYIDYGLLIALVIPIFAIMPLLTHAGLPNTADGPAHLMRQVELNQAWSQGDFYIRWGADLAFGYGMPIFNYTPPILYQLTQIIHLTGLPLDESMKVFLILDFLLYSVGMFLFARRIFGPYPALVAAAVHVYAPYRLREGYIQGSYGQFNALALYSVILWAFHGLITDGRPRYLVAAALSLAGLLLSHNISALHFVPLLAAYILLLLFTEKPEIRNSKLETLKQVLIAGLLGLGLAAIYWLPAIGERHYIQLEKITQGFFDFRQNFLSLSELIALPLPLDLAAINPEFPLSLGLAQIVAALAGITALLIFGFKWGRGQLSRPYISRLFSSSRFAHSIFFAIFFVVFIFLALPYSQIIWEITPLLELTEFPWRLLGPAIFCASILAAAAISIVNEQLSINNEKFNLFIVDCSLIIVIALNGYYLYPSQFIPWGTPTPSDTFAYEVTTGAIGTNSAAEMLPRWVQQPPQPDTLWPDYKAKRSPQKLDPTSLPPGATVEYISQRAESQTFRIDTPQEFVATLRTLYWPGWRLYLNEQPIPFKITKNTGLIQTTIPPGQHILTLQLESTPLRTVSLWLTLLSFAILIAIIIYHSVVKKGVRIAIRTPLQSTLPKPKTRNLKPETHIKPYFFVITTALLISTYLLSRPLAPLFTLQSDPNAPEPADQIMQVDFADQIRLVGVDELPQVIEKPTEGETSLNATLYWRALQELDTDYAVFLHLDAPNGQTFATVDEVNPENIPTHSWPPGLYLRNPLQLKIPANVPPIRYEITTGVYNRETGERLPIQPSQTNSFSLGYAWLTNPQADTFSPALASFGPHITLHQAELTGNTLTLLWQTSEVIEQNYTIFIHVLDNQGNLLNQADGVPFDGLYPLPHWLPGQLIEDTRLLDLSGQPQMLAIGIYDPATGQRLPAFDSSGQPLPDNSFVLTVTP